MRKGYSSPTHNQRVHNWIQVVKWIKSEQTTLPPWGLWEELKRQIQERSHAVQEITPPQRAICKPELHTYADGGKHIILKAPDGVIEEWLRYIEKHKHNSLRIAFEELGKWDFSSAFYEWVANAQLLGNAKISEPWNIITSFWATIVDVNLFQKLLRLWYTEDQIMKRFRSRAFELTINGASFNRQTWWIQLDTSLHIWTSWNTHAPSTLTFSWTQIPTRNLPIYLGSIKLLGTTDKLSRDEKFFTTLSGNTLELKPKNWEETAQHIIEWHGVTIWLAKQPLWFIDPKITKYLERVFKDSQSWRTEITSTKEYWSIESISTIREIWNRVSLILKFSEDIWYTGLHWLMYIWAAFPRLEDDIKNVVAILKETYPDRIKLIPSKHDIFSAESAIKVEETLRIMNIRLWDIDSAFYFKNRSGYPALTLNLTRIWINKNNIPSDLKTSYIKIAWKIRFGEPNTLYYATAYPMNPYFERGHPFNFDRVAFNTARVREKMKKIIGEQIIQSISYWYPEDPYTTPVFLEWDITEQSSPKNSV